MKQSNIQELGKRILHKVRTTFKKQNDCVVEKTRVVPIVNQQVDSVKTATATTTQTTPNVQNKTEFTTADWNRAYSAAIESNQQKEHLRQVIEKSEKQNKEDAQWLEEHRRTIKNIQIMNHQNEQSKLAEMDKNGNPILSFKGTQPKPVNSNALVYYMVRQKYYIGITNGRTLLSDGRDVIKEILQRNYSSATPISRQDFDDIVNARATIEEIQRVFRVMTADAAIVSNFNTDNAKTIW